MSTIIIISKCLGTIRGDIPGHWHKFHFKGVCYGKQIKGVYLKAFATKSNQPIKGIEYIIYFRALNLNGEILWGEILKMKPIDQCCDRS